MSNYCLRIGPMPQALADACSQRLESQIGAEPQALSLFEADAAGTSWQIEAYFASADEAAETARHVQALPDAAGLTIIVEPVGEADWVRQSLQGLGPIRAGLFFIHGSHDRALRPCHATAIELDAVLRKNKPKRVIDIGCGSGILAIAASRALRRRVLASDTDPEAVRITAANARLNGAAVKAIVAAGSTHRAIAAAGPYDLVMANILARPLVQLAPAIARITGSRGHLILSGLLTEQGRWVASVYQALGFVFARRFEEGGWATLVLRRG